MVTCCIDFSNKDLEISFFVFKPTVVIVDHLIHEIKLFSSRAQNLGCVQSSIFKSIHGNMVYICLSFHFSSFFKFSTSKSYCFKFSFILVHSFKKNCTDARSYGLEHGKNGLMMKRIS